MNNNHRSHGRHQGGLARIVSTPEKREYLVAQFLGEQPATVPPVLTDALRRKDGLQQDT
ncbi:MULTISPECIES: hypothetical protein [Corynebacterium]|uniref:hypothetical protein n=1 Tax=Corynebacterium TaxID=1716 RepID=UPI001658DECE|nr:MULTISPECIES: hypothetical protein [Corynebacterium]QNP91882.1 hypothetical protein IAU67_07620 [Corynebacterium zhongnanshanii]